METVLRVRQLFEEEKMQHRRINLNNDLEQTAAATGVNRKIASKIHAIEEVLNWKNSPGVPVAIRKELVIPNKFSIFVRNHGRVHCICQFLL